MSAIFYFFLQMIALQKLKNAFYFIWKALFVLEIIKFLYFTPPLFFLPVGRCFRGWSKINLSTFCLISLEEKRYDIETLFVDRLLNKEHFYGKSDAENVHQKLVPDPFLISVNNPKQPLHTRNYFKIKIFWKRFIKKP